MSFFHFQEILYYQICKLYRAHNLNLIDELHQLLGKQKQVHVAGLELYLFGGQVKVKPSCAAGRNFDDCFLGVLMILEFI